MKPEELRDTGPKLDADDIDAFEKEIGFKLPRDYREFLLQTNGGVLPEDDGYFYVEDADWWNGLHVFYGLRRPDAESISLRMVLRYVRESHPEIFDQTLGRLPIASDHLGNELYLVLTGPERGCVYFWMHDADVPPDKLSSSFESFLESVREKPAKWERPDLYPD